MKTTRPQSSSILFLFTCIYFFAVYSCAYATPNMMKWLGHASVKIRTSNGIIIYIDPYAGTDYADSADIVLITHEHSDHNVLSLIKQKPTCQVIRSAIATQDGVYQNFTIGDVIVKSVPAMHGGLYSCVGYIVEFDNIKVYHAGDTGIFPEMANLASQNISYALLPIDGEYTMTPGEATQAASMINAIYAVPIHIMSANQALFTPPNKILMTIGESIVLAHRLNSAPYLHQSIPTQRATTNQLFTFQIPDSTFLDNDIEDSLTYRTTLLPSWLNFDPQTHTFQGTPSQITSQPISIGIIASDIFQASTAAYFQLVILGDHDIIVSPGWNMVSIPRLPSDNNASLLFPEKSGTMFRYMTAAKGYQAAPTLIAGEGYWTNYTISDTITITGSATGPMTISTTQAGWVLIGSRETDLPLSSLILSNGASLIGSGMRYNPEVNNYVMVSTIKAGEACWILVNKACNILITED